MKRKLTYKEPIYLFNFKLPYIYNNDECYECEGGWNIGWKEFHLIKYKEITHRITKQQSIMREYYDSLLLNVAKQSMDWQKRWHETDKFY